MIALLNNSVKIQKILHFPNFSVFIFKLIILQVASSKKIEERTNKFIAEYERLSKENNFPSHEGLATIMGLKKKGTITEILGKRQNIQPDQWEKFKLHFGITTENSAQPINGDGNRQDSTVDKYTKLLEDNDRFFKTQYAEMLFSLRQLIAHGKKQEALLKLNLQHVGTIEALNRNMDPALVQEQINNQIAEMGTSEEMDNDDDKQDKP